MGCLEDSDVDDFAEGRLSGERFAGVVEHLASCAPCSEIVSIVAGSKPAKPPAPTELARGANVGRYMIVERIGCGAMGVVYAAYDPDLDRKVAIKLIREGARNSSRALTERMMREAQSMAKLSHPNVVTVYEVGLHDAGVFIAMELVEGRTLREVCANASRPVTEVVDLFRAAGAGLAAAHEAGLVHRDFKPDNVLVGADGRVRVTDFGLARLDARDENDSEGSGEAPVVVESGTLTRTGTILGTPAYMAPEVLSGDPATAASDQFAFAASFFESLHGHRPFPGDDVAKLRAAIVDGKIAPQSRSIPRWLARTIVRGLAADPAARHESIRAMLEALDAGAKRPSRGIALGVVGAVALIAMGTSLAILGRTRETSAQQAQQTDPCAGSASALDATWSDARRDKVRKAIEDTGIPGARETAARVIERIDAYAKSWSGAHLESCRATHVLGEQSTAVLDAKTSCLRHAAAELDAVAAGLERADAAGVAGALDVVASLPPAAECQSASALAQVPPRPADPAELARVEAVEADLSELRKLAAQGKVEEAARGASELAPKATAAGYRPLSAEVSLFAASSLRRLGKLEAAARFADSAIGDADASHYDMLAARAWLERASVAGEANEWSEASRHLGLAEAAIDRVGRPEHLLAALYHLRGMVAYSEDRYDDAEKELGRALEIRERLGNADEDRARTLTARGNLARLRGKLEDALELHRQAHALDEKIWGADHPALARHFHNEAGVLKRLHRSAEAFAAYGRALELEEKGFGKLHASVGRTRNSIGLLSYELGDLTRAKTELVQARTILESVGSVDLRSASYNLGLVLAASGEARAALEALREAIDQPAVFADGEIRIRARVAAARVIRQIGDDGAAKRASDELDTAAAEVPLLRDQDLQRKLLADIAAERRSAPPPSDPAPLPRPPAPPPSTPEPAKPVATAPPAPPRASKAPSPPASPPPKQPGSYVPQETW